ncbi:hypothetical protein [Nannocystis pusilla]|uniref:hypothetical protein n=1 Tax=Nannocystis pusilla TaxID=889268 RepID=UPI003B80A480
MDSSTKIILTILGLSAAGGIGYYLASTSENKASLPSGSPPNDEPGDADPDQPGEADPDPAPDPSPAPGIPAPVWTWALPSARSWWAS